MVERYRRGPPSSYTEIGVGGLGRLQPIFPQFSLGGAYFDTPTHPPLVGQFCWLFNCFLVLNCFQIHKVIGKAHT